MGGWPQMQFETVGKRGEKGGGVVEASGMDWKVGRGGGGHALLKLTSKKAHLGDHDQRVLELN